MPVRKLLLLSTAAALAAPAPAALAGTPQSAFRITVQVVAPATAPDLTGGPVPIKGSPRIERVVDPKAGRTRVYVVY